jgi:hypothetical protein
MARWSPIGIIDEPLHSYRVSSFQGSAEIEKMRTHPAHWHIVMDHYLNQPENRMLVDRGSIRLYELNRSLDEIICSTNLLVQGMVPEAQSRLRKALRWDTYYTGFLLKTKYLRLLFAGTILYLSTYTSAWPRIAQFMLTSRQRHIQDSASPITIG